MRSYVLLLTRMVMRALLAFESVEIFLVLWEKFSEMPKFCEGIMYIFESLSITINEICECTD